MSGLAPLKQLLRRIASVGAYQALHAYTLDMDGINGAAEARGHPPILTWGKNLSLTVAPSDPDLESVELPRDPIRSMPFLGDAVHHLKGWLELLTESQVGSKKQAAPSHDPGYRCVNWYGTQYEFTVKQGMAVAHIWKYWEDGVKVQQDSVLEAADSESKTLRVLFKNSDGKLHSAWGAMIICKNGRVTFMPEMGQK